MILHDATVVILKNDRNISGGIHFENALIVVEMDGEPTMEEITDFFLERVQEGKIISVKNTNFMTMHKWAEMLAKFYINKTIENVKQYTWVDNVPKRTGFLGWVIEKGKKK